jgi:hypothetical protein
VGGFGGGRMAGIRGGDFGGHIGGIRAGHSGYGGRRFARGGFYGYGLGCPYYRPYSSPYTCNY